MKFRFLLPLSFFFFPLFALEAQTVTADKTSGCAPLQVNFTASGGTTYSWDFGNGTTAGDTSQATAIYPNPGTFTVTCTINGSPKTLQINVFPKPVAGFLPTTTTDSCVGKNVSFQDTSTGGGGVPIVTWQWTFGDGGSSGSQNPNHTYSTTNGSPFTVSLIVTDANGCKNTAIDSALVHISNIIPIITTDTNPTAACAAPFTVEFSGQNSSSTSGTITDYIWDFGWDLGGSNDSSDLMIDTATYLSEGVFTASLTVIDTFNCHKKTTKTVVINNPIANFTVNDIAPINDTVCENVSFTNTSVATGSVTYQWFFGDGVFTPSNTGTALISGVTNSSGTYNNPTHNFANDLPYTPYFVSLVVTSSNLGLTCKDTLIDTIWVDGVRANFTSTPHYGCSMPFVVTYDGSVSTNGAQWDWTFLSDTDYAVSGQNTISGMVVVDTIITIDTNEYTTHWMELFDVELLVTSPDGCTHDTVFTANDTVYKPTALFMPDTINGCFPLTVTFYDSSVSNDTIVQWYWDFGDGTNSGVGGDELDTIIHTYNSPGMDSAYLIITNVLGCIDTSYKIVINVGGPPNVNFSATPLSVCVGEDVDFTDLTPVADSVDTWHYVTDGYHMWSCPNDPNPTYQYISDVGFFDVTLIAGYNGCYSETTIPGMIEVKGPIAYARYEGNCPTPFVYNFFSDSSKGFTSLIWNFGDGTPTSTLANPTHTYLATGDYSVILTASNNTTGCADSKDTIIVRVREIEAKIKATAGKDSLFCSGVPAQFSAALSQDVYGSCMRGYRWDWNDSTPPSGTDDTTMTHTFNTQGLVQVRLIVTDTNGCTDTTFQNVYIHKINADFVMDTTVGYFGLDTLLICVPQMVQFTDSTVADTGLASWFWISNAVKLPNDSIILGFTDTSTSQNPSFFYDAYNFVGSGVFMVAIFVVDSLGCTDSTKYYIRQSFPDDNFQATTSRQICVGDSVQFNANNALADGYLWDFGDGGSDSVKTPYHVFDSSGTFDIEFIVTDSVGCERTKTINNYVEVQPYPIAGFFTTSTDENNVTVLVDSNTVLCYPQQATFHDTTRYQYNVNWSWNYTNGTGLDSVASTTYNAPQDYAVNLIVQTTFGCSDTVSGVVSLVGPLANLYVSDTSICLYDSIRFSIKSDSADVFSWNWNFGDGTTDISQTDTVTHIYTYHPPSGVTTVTLTVYDPDSSCPKSKQQNIYIYDVAANFSINDTDQCLNSSFIFTDQSTGIIDTLNWDFGDGITSTGSAPQVHVYSDTGIFDVGLFISGTPPTTTKTCVDTLYIPITVYPLPTATANGDDTCDGDAIQIFAQGGLSYSWSPTAGLNDPNISDPVAGPNSTTVYTVTVTDANGCTDTDTAKVIIYIAPPQLALDTEIHIGDAVPIYQFDSGNIYTYSWTPVTEGLSCTDCPSPTATPQDSIIYSIIISDNIGCFSVTSTYEIRVLKEDALDVPDVFTPGADVNNFVRARGWGVKKVLVFKIYNRWGQEVFAAQNFDIYDASIGWDGNYLGKPQNMDTYVWYAKWEGYLSAEPKEKKGYLVLIR